MAITGQVRRRRIAINADAYISGATPNVPVLVKFNSTSHPDLFATGDYKDSVWFSSDAGGQTTLYHEGVVFSATDAIFYVKVDLSSTADTVIYFWYGQPSITGTESKTNVWTNARAIYHLGDTSDIINGYTLTNKNTVAFSSAVVGNGAVFARSSAERLYHTTSLFSGNNYTVLVWAKPTTPANNNYMYLFCDAGDAGNRVTLLYQTETSVTSLNFGRYDTTSFKNYRETVTLSTSDYSLIGMVSDTSNSKLYPYINGNNLGNVAIATNLRAFGNKTSIGSNVDATPTHYYDGVMDEMWFFTDAKSADFIKAVYNNVQNYSTFITIDGAVSIGSSPIQVYPIWEVQSGTAYQDTVEFTLNASTTATATLTDVETVTFTETILFSQSSGYLEGFSKRIELTIDSSKVDGDLTDFPILIKLSSSSGISESDLTSIFTELGSNSKKIAVTTSNNTQCYVEIERWDNANNLAILWAKIPSISHEADTTLYLYYDSSASDNTTYVGDTDSEVAENVWDSDYKGVFHFNSETAIKDSTSNDYDSTSSDGTQYSYDGKIGKGLGLVRASYIDYNFSGSMGMSSGTTFTLQICYKTINTSNVHKIFKGGGSSGELWYYANDNLLAFRVDNYDHFLLVTDASVESDFTFITIVRNGTGNNFKIYINGVEKSINYQGYTQPDGSFNLVNIGYNGDINGILDESRFSNTNRSESWIIADYYSQDDNLITYGSFETPLQSVFVKFILTHEATETVTFAATAAKTDVEVIEFTVNVSSEVIDLDEVVPFTANYSFTVEAILSHTQTIEFTETATFEAVSGKVDVEVIEFTVNVSSELTLSQATNVSVVPFTANVAATVEEVATYVSTVEFTANATFAAIKEVTDVELVEFGVTATATVLPTQLSSLIEFTETATFAAAKTTIDVEVIEFAANVSMDVFEGEGTQDLVEFAVNPSFEVIAVFEYVKTVEFSGIYGLITPSLALNLTPIEFQEVASFKVMDVELIKFSATVTFEAAKTVTDIEVIEFSAVFTPSVTEMDEILNFIVTATPSVTAVLTDIELIEFAATATFEASKPLIDVEVIEFSATFTPEIETYQAELIEFTVIATPKEVVNFPSPYPDWKYRKSKEIIGSNNALTDYQMKLTLHYGSGTDDDDNVYLNSHSKTDFSDIRFSHDSVSLDYFIEDKVDEDYAIVWIEIDSISTSGETIYIYYGYSSAADESSGENTFVDFVGSSITSYSETPNLDPSGKFRYRARLERYSAPVGNLHDTYFGLKNTDGTQYLKFQLMWDTSLHRIRYWAKRTAEWMASPVSLDSDTIQKFTLIKNEDGVYFYSDNGGTYALIEYWYTNYIPNATLGLFYYDNEEYLGITWAFLAKYTDTEPTFSTTGEEEQSGLTDRDNIDLFWILSTLEITVTAATSFEINSWSILIEFTVTATFESHYPIFDVELIEFSATFETKISYAKIYVDLDELKVESISVNKSIQDATWNCDITIDGTETISFFRHVTVEIPDHNSVSRVVFVGFIPTSNHVLASVTNKSKATAYDYSWYLSVQQMPDEYLITNAEPSTIILALLGGEDWETVTGINPYQLIEVEDWATITKTFIWDRKTTKHQAIQEICEYIGYIFLIKWKLISGFYYPIAYFVPKDDIDTYLDLPSPITITSGVSDQHVIEGISIENTQVESVNRVIVKGIDAATGTYYSSTKESLSVTDKEEIPIEIYYESADLNTQEKADDKAEEIYDLLQELPKTYDVQLINRTDLELYQKIKFVGYSQIDEVYYRIISINYSKIGINTKVSIKLAKDDDLSNLANILRNNSGDFTNNITKIVDSRLDSMPTVAIGRILAINGSVATVELEDGSGNIEARLLNQT